MSSLSHDDRGAGEPVVLLPPFPFDRRFWAGNVPALLGAGFRVITVDYPGFAAAEPPPPADLSIAGIADRTAALLDHLGLQRATLLGMSMGGYVALAFAARFTARLRALVLADTRAAADSEAALRGRAQALETIATRGVSAYLDGSLPRLLAPDAPASMLAAARAIALDRRPPLEAGIAALRDRPDRTADARALACPTLVVCGAGDQVTPVHEMRALAGAITGARSVELTGAGHLSSFEAQPTFDRAIVEFLTTARMDTEHR